MKNLLKINNKNLSVVALSDGKVALSVETKPTNRILILDGSGSTYSFIDKMKQDIIDECERFSDTDTVSVGYFSSSGQYGWVCKGASPKTVRPLLQNFKFPMNMTCYSEILKSTVEVIETLKPISNIATLIFATDGYPNQQTDTINKLSKELSQHLASTTIIGYGDYYGRNVLSEMAQNIGGTLVHASNLREFNEHVKTSSGSANLSPKRSVPVPSNLIDNFVISVSPNGIVTHLIEGRTEIFVDSETSHLLYSSKLNPTDTYEFSEDTFPLAYAAARAYLQAAQYNDALDILGELGDVFFIDRVNNSFTVSEYGAVENHLLKAINDPTFRFKEGRKANYIPKPDAFCMLDLADLLVNDKTAKFMPYHPAFSYNKIGRGSTPKGDYPKFEAGKDVRCSTSSLTWNSSRLNLSFLAKIHGHISLDDKAPEVGLNQLFNTFVYRNYALVVDGRKNVSSLVLSDLSEDTLDVLKKHKLIESQVDGVVVVDLSGLPVVNRKIATDYTDLDNVCKLLRREKQLEAENKTFSYLYNEFPESLREGVEDLVKPTSFTDAQVLYLSKFGVKKDGSFAPEVTLDDPTDFYTAKVIEFGIKGLNSLPKVSDVLAKIADNKKITSAVQKLVADAYSTYLLHGNSGSDASKALWLKEAIDKNKKELYKLRSELNRVKFAVVLGKTNFDQLPVLKEKNEYEYDGLFYELVLKDVEVKI